MRVDNRMPVFSIHVQDIDTAGDSGIIDQYVEPAMPFDDSGHHLIDRLFISYIQRNHFVPFPQLLSDRPHFSADCVRWQ